MSEHNGLPSPFFDDSGFPLCLLAVRGEIESRGGRIIGEGLVWRVTHPDPGLPDIVVTFYEEGEVVVSSGPRMWVEEFCSADRKWWERGVWRDCPYTWVESAVLAFVTGNSTVWTWTDEDGQERSLTVADGPCVSERGGYDAVPTDERASRIPVTEWRYPAWPPAGKSS
ncbi:MAG: hypothetical protein ACREX8_19340 [Gammaproteobacteria bacterium]